MKPEERIFAKAMEHAAEERAAIIDQECNDDTPLRQRVLALLRGYEGVGAKLEASPFAAVAAVARAQDADSPREDSVGTRIGRYKLLQRLGEGGCGVVFLAEQEEPVRRRVALKVIKFGMDTDEVIVRFEAERQALALMDHPHIAHVLDAGATENGRPFFVMELVQGVPITHHCDQHQLSTIERIRLFIQVCSAIQHAHQKGIIHRDLKPSNILVTLLDGVPVPKIIDFGIAKAMHGRLSDRTLFTAVDQFIGTPAYMSPEQMEMSGNDVDTRSDLYSLGVLLYELVTGRTPFESHELQRRGLEEMRRTIREKAPAKPSTRVSTLEGEAGIATAKQRSTNPAKLRSGLRGDVDWIVMCCLEKDRTRRYETASALATDLQRYLRHEPISARPPSTFYILRQLFRRNQLSFGAAAAVLVALVAGLGFSALSLVRERAARQRADLEVVRSAQVARLMQDMLAGVAPQVAIGRDTRLLRTTLDETVLRINTQLRGQPEVEASFRETLGNVYRDLGELSSAASMYVRALQLRRETLGPEHVTVADLLHELGEINRRQGRLSEAEGLLRDALALREKTLGTKHAATSASRRALTHVQLLLRPSSADSKNDLTALANENTPTVIHMSLLGGTVEGKPILPTLLSIAYQQHSLEQEFERDGIRIEWSFPSFYTANETVLRGVPDFSQVGPVNALVARATGRRLKLLMPIRGSGAPLGLVVRPDSSFQTMADLKGKRLGTCKGTRMHVALCRLIEKYGFTERDFVIVGFPGIAATDTAFTAGEIDAAMSEIGEAAEADQLRGARVISDLSSDHKLADAPKLAVSAEFAQKYPTVVQRVVTTLVRSAAWISDERNRPTVLNSWASSAEQRAALASANAGHLLKQRMSPLVDDFFMAELRRASDDAKRFGLISADADVSLDGWVEPIYVERALADLGLKGFWPESDGEGKPKNDQVRAHN